jgi:hypothetical protein
MASQLPSWVRNRSYVAQTSAYRYYSQEHCKLPARGSKSGCRRHRATASCWRRPRGRGGPPETTPRPRSSCAARSRPTDVAVRPIGVGHASTASRPRIGHDGGSTSRGRATRWASRSGQAFLHVDIHDPPVPVGHMRLRLGHGLMGRAVWAESAAVGRKRRAQSRCRTCTAACWRFSRSHTSSIRLGEDLHLQVNEHARRTKKTPREPAAPGARSSY